MQIHNLSDLLPILASIVIVAAFVRYVMSRRSKR